MRITIPVVFFALAAWFVLRSGAAPVPLPERVVVDAAAFASDPVRRVPDDPTIVTIGSVPQKCNDCHGLFETRTERGALAQHTDIVLDHGLNDRCLNCHGDDDRSRLVLHDGELVGFDEVVRLCAKCHGPTFRDWEAGIHGRTNGYWDEALGPRHRLRCTDCHDPHAPAFVALQPLPGPNTLRMGAPPEHVDAGHERTANPLDIGRARRAHGSHHGGPSDG